MERNMNPPFTWLAVLRDGTQIAEFSGQNRISVEILQDIDVAELHLLPNNGTAVRIIVRARPGERIEKKWICGVSFDMETGDYIELPVVESFTLISSLPVNHFFLNNELIVTTDGYI